jgi:hypothetical protein
MKFEDVMSTTEAARRWNVSPTTIKIYCLGTAKQAPKFKKGECRKSGNMWLVTREAMVRLFGDEPDGK